MLSSLGSQVDCRRIRKFWEGGFEGERRHPPSQLVVGQIRQEPVRDESSFKQLLSFFFLKQSKTKI